MWIRYLYSKGNTARYKLSISLTVFWSLTDLQDWKSTHIHKITILWRWPCIICWKLALLVGYSECTRDIVQEQAPHSYTQKSKIVFFRQVAPPPSSLAFKYSSTILEIIKDYEYLCIIFRSSDFFLNPSNRMVLRASSAMASSKDITLNTRILLK